MVKLHTDDAPADHPMQHRPTHDWIIGQKIHAPDRETMPEIHGVVRVAGPAPHHYVRVIAVGPGRANTTSGFTPSPIVMPGDVVMVRAVAGDGETIEGVEYHWFIPDEIMAVLP